MILAPVPIAVNYEVDDTLSCLPIVDAIARRNPFAVATAYDALGISTIPVKLDGSKEPLFAGWREYAVRRPSSEEIWRWHGGRACGIGVTGGTASGNLVVLDFETRETFDAWCRALSVQDKTQLARCPVVMTPGGGVHIWVRLVEAVKGCKLARTESGQCLIETRGSNHYVLAPGSPASAHKAGKPYRLVKVGWLDSAGFEPMSLEVWHGLTVYAAELNRYARPMAREVIGDRPACAPGSKPGDDFNQRVLWGDILSPFGWKVFRSTGTTTYWTRPGKSPPGISASTGFCRGPNGNDLMYVFSTSAAPFEAEHSYSKFAAYATLNFAGDFRAATRALGAAGYGLPARKAVHS